MVGGEGGGFKKLPGVGSLLGYPQQLGEVPFYEVRVGQLSRSSQGLLLPLGVPGMPARSDRSVSQDHRV